MTSDIIDLADLINYAVNEDCDGKSLRGSSSAGRNYGKRAKKLVAKIPKERGFYSWGKYQSDGQWLHIYIGATYRKAANLRSRILEELKDEKHFLWCSLYADGALLTKGEACYPEKWSTYRNHWIRSLLKKGTSHIIWVAIPDLNNRQMVDVEADLIFQLKPRANISRPVPGTALQSIRQEVIRHFRRFDRKRDDD